MKTTLKVKGRLKKIKGDMRKALSDLENMQHPLNLAPHVSVSEVTPQQIWWVGNMKHAPHLLPTSHKIGCIKSAKLELWAISVGQIELTSRDFVALEDMHSYCLLFS